MPSLVRIVAIAAASLSGLAGQNTGPLRPVPLNPADAVIDAFKDHALVALGEGTHGGTLDQAVRLGLLRDSRLLLTVNDIVVEWGNSRYQAVVDRYVNGEPVPDDELRRVWENTTPWDAVFDGPLYREWFNEVRRVNGALPAERRMRVLLGDPPIDWDAVTTDADVATWGDQRDAFAAALVRREVLEKSRRALLLFGSAHFQRRNERRNFETSDFLVGLLEEDTRTRVYTIWSAGRDHTDLRSLDADATKWPTPSIVGLRGTALGAKDVSAFYTIGPRMEIRDGRRVVLTPNEYRPLRMEEQFDAVLWVGPPGAQTVAGLTARQCADPRYMDMRTARMKLALGMAGGGAEAESAIGRLRRYCETQTRR